MIKCNNCGNTDEWNKFFEGGMSCPECGEDSDLEGIEGIEEDSDE